MIDPDETKIDLLATIPPNPPKMNDDLQINLHFEKHLLKDSKRKYGSVMKRKSNGKNQYSNYVYG